MLNYRQLQLSVLLNTDSAALAPSLNITLHARSRGVCMNTDARSVTEDFLPRSIEFQVVLTRIGQPAGFCEMANFVHNAAVDR